MQRPPRALLAVSLLTATFLAGCTAESLPDPPTTAGWKSGFRFQYQAEASVDFHFEEYENGTLKQSGGEENAEGLQPAGDHEVLTTGVRHGGNDYYLVLARPSGEHFRGNSLVAIRASDLAEVTAHISGGQLQVYDRGQVGPVRFPMQVGDSWEYRQSFFGDAPSGEGSMQGAAKVTGVETVDGPDGPVKALRIVHTMEMDNDRFKAEVDRMSMNEDYEDVEASGDASGRMVVHYAPSLHAVVLAEMNFDVHYDVSFTEEGIARRYVFEGSGTMTRRLTSATLQAASELSLADVGKAIELGRRPGSPDTLPAGVKLGIQLPTERPIVENETMARFSVNIQASGLSNALRVELHEEDGLVDSESVPANGGAADLRAYRPGLHRVVVRSQGNDPVATASAWLPIDARYVFEPDCPLVPTGLAVCQPFPFFVRADVEAVAFTVRHEGLAVEPGSGTLYLEDPDGRRYQESMVAEHEATVRVDGGVRGSFQPWAASFAPLGPAGRITYVVDLIAVDGPSAADADAVAFRPWPLAV